MGTAFTEVTGMAFRPRKKMIRRSRFRRCPKCHKQVRVHQKRCRTCHQVLMKQAGRM
jgi:hypothetical protein